MTRMATQRIALEPEHAPGLSVPLNFDLSCPTSVKTFCSWCVGEVLDFRSLATREAEPSTVRKLEDVVDLIVANFLGAHRISPQCFVGISRNSNSYTKTRYRQRQISFQYLKLVLDWLLQSNPPYVSLVESSLDRRSRQRVKGVSRFKGTDRFFEALQSYRATMAGRTVQTISLTDLTNAFQTNKVTAAANFSAPSDWAPLINPSSDCIRLQNSDGELERYEDTAETDEMRERLTKWNEFAALHHLDILLRDSDFENLFQRHQADEEDELNAFLTDEHDRPQFIQLERFRVHRVFKNSSFAQGGRFNGGWWQRVPKKFRRYITINGKPTREYDHSNLHFAMLYAVERQTLDGDAYMIRGLENHRMLVKTTLLKLINAHPTTWIAPAKKTDLPEGLSWDDLLELVKAKHRPIANHLRSGIGLTLQKIDAQIAEDVMLAMMKKDRLALPVRDSFITYTGFREPLVELMKASYQARLKAVTGFDPDLTFLDQQISDERLASDPDPEEIIDNRLALPEYAGYSRRLEHFLDYRTNDWHKRFGV